jgi:membrane protease subunit HflC
MPTKDKTYIRVDTFARWRISDPMQFFSRLKPGIDVRPD